jgi:L-alanine-DL-glutamate epimerase-like enolase superfamily enzyme
MVRFVELGTRAVKMKVGAVSITEDAERVRAVRKAIGPEIKLMIDANCAYRAYDAISLAKRVDDRTSSGSRSRSSRTTMTDSVVSSRRQA